MAKKNFFEQAKKSVAKLQGNQPSIEEETILNTVTKQGMHIGARLKEARLIPINKIKPDPDQPRKSVDKEKLEELSKSIKRDGVQQPISVEYIFEEDGYFKIIAGERRYQASLLANKKDIPCIVTTEVEYQKRKRLQLIENFHREDLNPIDRARGLIEYKNLLGVKWVKVEEELSIQPRRRQQLLALLNLPEDIQSEIVSLGNNRSNENVLTEKHARALLRLKENENNQRKLFEQIKEEKISGDDAMQLAKSMINTDTRPVKKMIFKYHSKEDLIKQLESKLKELLSSDN